MKILYFAYIDPDTPSACLTHTLGVLRGLAANGCQVDAVLPHPLHALEEIPSVRFHFIRRYDGKRRYLLWQIPLSTMLLLALCRKNRFDAIYARYMDASIGPRLCSQIFHLPLFLEIDDTPIVLNYPPILRRIVAAKLKRDFEVATGLIVPSVPRCRLIREHFDIPDGKIHMILNGTEPCTGDIPAKTSARGLLQVPTESFCLVYVGVLTDRYDFETLLKAMARSRDRIPQLQLVVIGGGPETPRIRQQALELGLADCVTMTGFLPQSTLPELVPGMDVGFMTLTSNAVAEHGPIHTKLGTYGMFSLPVVTAGHSMDGYPSEIRDSVVLVPPGDDEALAETIVWLHQNPAERERIAGRLHDFVLRRLTWDAVTADILAIMGAP